MQILKKMKMKNLYKISFYNTALLLGFVALVALISSCSDGANNANNSIEKGTLELENTLVLVETVTPTMQNFAKELKVVGTVEPLQWVDILPLESGQISQVLVDIGDSVEKGDLLILLVNPIITREVEALKVEAEAATKQLSRIREASASALPPRRGARAHSL